MTPVHDYVKRANVTPKFRVLFAPFNSESGVKILGTGLLLFGGYFNSSISGVIFTPEKEFFKLLFGVKILYEKYIIQYISAGYQPYL